MLTDDEAMRGRRWLRQELRDPVPADVPPPARIAHIPRLVDRIEPRRIRECLGDRDPDRLRAAGFVGDERVVHEGPPLVDDVLEDVFRIARRVIGLVVRPVVVHVDVERETGRESDGFDHYALTGTVDVRLILLDGPAVQPTPERIRVIERPEIQDELEIDVRSLVETVEGDDVIDHALAHSSVDAIGERRVRPHGAMRDIQNKIRPVPLIDLGEILLHGARDVTSHLLLPMYCNSK
ncbi:MAG: hypothetical protein QM775_25630 [Pirellulales bacterium]